MGYSPWGHKESDTTEWLVLSEGEDFPFCNRCFVLTECSVQNMEVVRLPPSYNIGRILPRPWDKAQLFIMISKSSQLGLVYLSSSKWSSFLSLELHRMLYCFAKILTIFMPSHIDSVGSASQPLIMHPALKRCRWLCGIAFHGFSHTWSDEGSKNMRWKVPEISNSSVLHWLLL